MATLMRRLQVLLDEDQAARLKRESARTGAPIGALIRAAIDRTYPSPVTDRESAAARLLAAEPMPVEDWAEMKRRMRDEMSEPTS